MNQPYLQILSVTTREMTSKTGRPMLFQSALFHRGDGGVFPTEFLLQDAKPVATGNYAIAPASYEPGRYGMEFRPRPGDKLPAVAATKVA
jgi:hypothetical protein